MTDDLSKTAGTSLTMRLDACMTSLSRSEQAIGRIILDAPLRVANMTISELARSAGTSEATVTRFCRRLGLPGYAQLRLQLAAQADHSRSDFRPGLSLTDDIGAEDTLADIVQKTAFSDIRAAEETVAQLDLSQLEQLVDAIRAAKRVVVFGVGALGPVVQDITQKLFRIDVHVSGWNDIHNALSAVSMLEKGDVVLVLTHSGRTVEGIELLSKAGERKAHRAVVTSNPLSDSALLADTVLISAARETLFRNGGMASRMAQQIILDCLFVALAHRQFDRVSELFAEAHDAVRQHRKEN
ncbi:MurR/RpiR family transcriptional regulator [Paracoccus aerodenitrificans]|uniref:MurR/RpiR family transcriptional regulator n=1 Tax=Paracoccus aerodenitrificans TaxID=3017781 RepID=UPI0022F092FD|nr:MurR/RpiR family transcriptional regulator [Paracoccus aerodenitrificans]WBU64130.1 MurR/RpiR family transcriptional regulator [Paracoccus aerodenitrificans]